MQYTLYSKGVVGAGWIPAFAGMRGSGVIWFGCAVKIKIPVFTGMTGEARG